MFYTREGRWSIRGKEGRFEGPWEEHGMGVGGGIFSLIGDDEGGGEWTVLLANR